MIRVRRAKVHRSVGLTEASSEAEKFAWYLLVDIPASSTEARKLVRYPANIPGLGEALIFFCCFSSIKGRKAGRETPRNSGLQPIAKKQHAQIPDYSPLLRSNTA